MKKFKVEDFENFENPMKEKQRKQIRKRNKIIGFGLLIIFWIWLLFSLFVMGDIGTTGIDLHPIITIYIIVHGPLVGIVGILGTLILDLNCVFLF